MVREIPGESSQPIGGVRNSLLRKAIQGVTADILNREVYIRGMSNEEKSMMDKDVIKDSKVFCQTCNQPASSDCEICNGNIR